MGSIFIGKEIEVIHINPLVKSVGIVIHLYCSPDEALLPETQDKVAHFVRFGVQYLIEEGFLPETPTDWITHIGGIVHQN
jgi:hypothetical protein